MIDDPSTDSLLLVMEHVDGGSLEQPYNADAKTWETLPEAVVHRYFRELCKVRCVSTAMPYKSNCPLVVTLKSGATVHASQHLLSYGQQTMHSSVAGINETTLVTCMIVCCVYADTVLAGPSDIFLDANFA